MGRVSMSLRVCVNSGRDDKGVVMSKCLQAGYSILLALCLASCASQPTTQTPPAKHASWDEKEVAKAANDFFGNGAEGIGKAIAKAFKEQGEPVAIIRGEEGGGAAAVGVRYGKGEFSWKGGSSTAIYWQGPTLGFDFGGNAAKVFILVYKLPNEEALFQRYPGVEGSAYFVGGVGLNYNSNGTTVLAPVRLGVGWRLGASIDYINFSKEKRIVPF
jgi:hypothetical protein